LPEAKPGSPRADLTWKTKDGMRGMEDNCKKKNAEVLQKIIFHLSEAYKLFNDLKDRRVSAVEPREWQNTIKLCKDAIEFINGKVDSMKKIVK
jgi:hypothetical protein